MCRKSTAISLVLIGTTSMWFGCSSRTAYRPTGTDTSPYRSGSSHHSRTGFWPGFFMGRAASGGSGGSTGGAKSGTIGGTSRGGFGASGHATS
jgi:hypothetical protein